MHFMDLVGIPHINAVGIFARSRKSAILLAAIAATSLPASLRAADVTSTWNGTTGKWTDASCWLNNPATPGYPASSSSTYYVVLTGPNAGYVVTLDTGITIQSLNLDADATLNQTWGQLTLNADSTISHGTYILANGALGGSGNLLVSSNFTWGGGEMLGTGKTIITPGGTLQISGTTGHWLRRTMDNSGSITSATPNVYLQGGTLNNLAAGTFTISSGQYYDYGGTFNNAGTFTKTTDTPVTIAPTFNNSGTVKVDAGTLYLSKGTDAGTYTIAQGATVDLSGSRTYNAGTSFTGSGTVSFSGGTQTFAGSIDATAPLKLTGGTLDGAGNLTIKQSLAWTGGDMSGAGKTTIAPDASLQISGNNWRWFKRTIDNSGSITHADANLYLQGTLNNLAGANFTMSSGQYINYSGTFNNAGTFTKTTDASVTIAPTFNNTGVVSIQGGTLQIDDGTDSGTYTIADGATLRFTGNRTYNPATRIEGPGSLNFTSASHDFSGQINSTGPLTITSGTVNFNADQQLTGPVQLSGGTLAGSGSVTINQSLTWTNGDMSGSGKTIIAPGASLQISGNNWRWFKRILDNNGSITHTDANFYLQGNLINNLAGASFTMTSGQYHDYSGTFNNAGTFTKTGADLAIIAATFNNTGTVSVQAGTLRLDKGTDTGRYDLANGATLNLMDRTYNGTTFTGQGTVVFAAGTQTIAGATDAFAPVKFIGGTLAGTGNFTVKQSLTWTGGEMSGAGKTIIAPDATLQISGTDWRWFRRTLDNSGAITHADTNLYLQGTLNNLAGANFTMSSGQYYDYSGTFNNAGTLTKTTGNLARFTATFNNTGAVNVQAGTLQIAKGADTGDYTIADGAKLNFDGNHTFASDTVITGPGSLSFLSGTHDFAGQFQSPGDVSIKGSARLNLTGAPDRPQIFRQLSLDSSATLDLGQSDLVIQATTATRTAVLNEITAYIKSSRNYAPGRWKGPGLTSSAAQSAPLTGLAVVLNDKGNGTPILPTLNGQSLTANDILVKYTWNGDVNLDGVIDAADYFLVDSGFITQKGGYRNGDLNFDNAVDAADYFLIDSAFIGQNSILASTPSTNPIPVPEPAALTLLALPSLLLLRRRRVN